MTQLNFNTGGQVCVPVDNRVIVKELFTGLFGMPHIQDFETLGKFFDDNLPGIIEFIAKYYQYRLSDGRDCTQQEMTARLNALFDNCFANLFPFMDYNGYAAVKQTFMDVLTDCYNKRITPPDTAWDKCELVALSLDSYVVKCVRVIKDTLLMQPTLLQAVA